jgi:hypothetical protein
MLLDSFEDRGRARVEAAVIDNRAGAHVRFAFHYVWRNKTCYCGNKTRYRRWAQDPIAGIDTFPFNRPRILGLLRSTEVALLCGGEVLNTGVLVLSSLSPGTELQLTTICHGL